MAQDRQPFRIESWRAVEGRADIERGVDAVFFSSSATQAFADAAARAAFRERWLGRYLRQYPAWATVALDAGGEVAGYLVGAFDDPALTPFFDDIGYFKSLADVTARYPAHLHVNVAERYRGEGLGAVLVTRFCDAARAAGAPGVHVVTGRGARNVGFYARCGFREVAAFTANGKTLVMLGRAL